MIHAGQNNGYPWGPVGEHAQIHGAQFLPGTYQVALVKGDVDSAPDNAYEFCKLSQKVYLGGTVTADGAGNFDMSFDWPAAASSGAWSVCAYMPQDIAVPVGNIDDGPFTVLAAHAPAISVSPSTVVPGGNMTVTGKNWVPPQSVHVYIGACADCGGPQLVSQDVTSSGLNSGTFSVTLRIPADAAPGAYVAGAVVSGGTLDVGPSGAKHVTIAAATPTPTPKPSPMATNTPVGTSPGLGTGGASGGEGDNTGLIVGLVLAIIVVLAALAGMLAYYLTRRGGMARGIGGPGQGARVPVGSYSPPGAFAPPPPPAPDWRNMQGGGFDAGGTALYPNTPQPRVPDDTPTDPDIQIPRDPYQR
jgi:hypothetical protein